MTKPEDRELVDNSTSLEIVKMYFDEWKYRHENFWKRLTQFAIITFFTSSMPITYRIFQSIVLPRISMLFFPVCGIILALVSWLFCLSEYKRLEAVNNRMNSIIKTKLGEGYAKQELTDKKLRERIFNARIGIWLPGTIMVMQMALAGLIIWIILTNRM